VGRVGAQTDPKALGKVPEAFFVLAVLVVGLLADAHPVAFLL
jgi:hypothetical protein